MGTGWRFQFFELLQWVLFSLIIIQLMIPR